MKEEFQLTPEQKEILKRYYEKKDRIEKDELLLRETRQKLPRLSIKELQKKYGGKNWGIKTSKEEKKIDPSFSLEANRRLWQREFEGHGYNAPTSSLDASMSLRKLIGYQNENRKSSNSLSD